MTALAAATVSDTGLTGALLLAPPLAALGGLVSFFSPCVLPLVPGYLSYVTGVSGADLAEARRGRTAAGAALSIAGFSAAFIWRSGWPSAAGPVPGSPATCRRGRAGT